MEAIIYFLDKKDVKYLLNFSIRKSHSFVAISSVVLNDIPIKYFCIILFFSSLTLVLAEYRQKNCLLEPNVMTGELTNCR